MRPLTANMVETLRTIAFRCRNGDFRCYITSGEMTQAERNAAKALMARGLVWRFEESLSYAYALTEAGVAETRNHKPAASTREVVYGAPWEMDPPF